MAGRKNRKVRKPKKFKGGAKYAKGYNPDGYRINTTGLRRKLKGRRILDDLTADLSKYEDTREPVMPGKTIKNSFRAYPWKNSPYDTVKG
jgi:hypothetical protein